MLEKLLENTKALQDLLSTMLSAFIYPTVMYLKICTVFVVLLLLSIGEGNSDPTSPQWGMSYIKVRDKSIKKMYRVRSFGVWYRWVFLRVVGEASMLCP